MKAKYVIGLVTAITGLVTAIVLSASLAIAQQPAPPQLPSADDFGNTFSLFVDGGGFLGVYAENIDRENMGRYRLNQPLGVGVTQVMQDSPAEKAGLRKDDVILRINNEDVTSVRKLNRLVSEIAFDHTVKMTISRNGSEQELTATMGKRKNPTVIRDLFPQDPKTWKWEGRIPGVPDVLPNADGNDVFILGNGRRIGVSTMELTKQLADYFGITDGKGVLVTSVSEDGPAAKSGIKAGDVITAVDGEAVDSPGDISRVINRKKEGEVTLTVIRNKSPQTFRVTPREGSGFPGSIGRPQVGRQIFIPRINFPDVDIVMPRIEIPAVNIDMPRVRVTPRPFRLVRPVNRPI